MRSQEEILVIFRGWNSYFKRMENPSFKPEYDASTKVLQIIEKGKLEKQNLEEIVSIFNQVTEEKHYDGSGWLDFQIRIEFLLRERGLETFNDGDKIRIRE